MSQASAGEVVQAELRRLVEQWQRLDPLVRSDAPDAVHRMRVLCRRLRSLLVSFRPMFDREVTGPLREELKWYAALLGEARDAEVMRERLSDLLHGQPADLVEPEAVDLVSADLGTGYEQAHEAVATAMRRRRYQRTRDRLVDLAERPPWSRIADQPAGEVLPSLVGKEWKRLRRRARRVAAADGQGGRDEALHEVRKAAKRLRYAAEVAGPVGGASAEAMAKAAKRLQSVLGDRQDGVVTQARLHELSARVEGESGFTLGRLHAVEQRRAVEADAAYAQAWAAMDRKRLRRWLG